MLKSQARMSELAQTLTEPGAPKELVDWLIKLKLLVGVPYNYLVPDQAYLPPESIRFFHLDPNWIDALVDGALSIGRHYNGADPETQPVTLHTERAGTRQLQAEPDLTVGNFRRRQLRRDDGAQPNAADVAAAAGARGPVNLTAGTGGGVTQTVRTGFLLNSTVVRDWKSIDVAGYPQGASPYDYEQGTIETDAIKPLDILRLVRLSPSIMFGLFEGDLYELVLHQPPEAIHFGFDQIEPNGEVGTVTKGLRVPTTNWDDPTTDYDANDHKAYPLKNVFVDPDSRVLDMMQVSRDLAAQLNALKPDRAPGYYKADPKQDPNFIDHLVSSDFGLEMVQGVGLVSFINKANP